jgi:antitoxin component YwqK of YwqJK toxin-antitoxin module
MKYKFTLALFTLFSAVGLFAQNDAVEYNNYSEREDKNTLFLTNNNLVNVVEHHDEANSHILLNAHFKNGKLHHSWYSQYANGIKCDSGYFKNGIPEGEWKHWDITGNLRMVRNFSNTKYHRVTDEISKQVKHPTYTISRLAKQNKNAAWQHLQTKETAIKSKDYKTKAIHNVTGNAGYASVYNECLYHGLYMNLNENGVVVDSGYYKDGLRDGVWLERDITGNTITTGLYKQGKKNKEWKQYDAQHRLIGILIYKEGEQTYQKQFR